MKMTSAGKTASLILKTVVVAAAVTGTAMSAAAGGDAFMGGSRVFMYFTIQSNIAIALICLAGFFFTAGKARAGTAVRVIKFAGTVSITLTGAVFCFVLAPTLGEFAWVPYNVLTHVVVPAAAVADFFVCGAGAGLDRKYVVFVTLPPLAYALYAGIGYAAGLEFMPGINYPYFFLNWGSPAGAFGFSSELPFMGCAWWILALSLLLVLTGFGYLGAADMIEKRAAGAEKAGGETPAGK